MQEEEGWTCSVCTYNNRSEAFKCNICDTRKGTSTRKPRVTANIVAQQIASSFPLIPAEVVPAKLQKTGANSRRSTRNNSPVSVLAKNVDLDSRVDVQVTVGDHTVVISDYKLLKRKQTTKNNNNSEENNGEASLETSENSDVETANSGENNGVETSVASTSTSAKTQQQKHDDENKPAVSDDKTNNDVKMTSKNSDASGGTAAAVEK